MRDIALIASKFGSVYPEPRYDPNCDLTGEVFGLPDGKINMRDLGWVAIFFGEVAS